MGTKISALTELTSGSVDTANDVLPIVDASGPTTMKVKVASLLAPITTVKGVVIDGGNATITTGSKGFVQVPFNCNVVEWRLFGDTTGSVVFDIKSCTYSSYPTTTSIVASNGPTLSSASKNKDTTLTGWTTSLNAGDYLEFVISSISGLTKLRLELILKPR
jgi:hypothetical protein